MKKLREVLIDYKKHSKKSYALTQISTSAPTKSHEVKTWVIKVSSLQHLIAETKTENY